MHFQGRLTDLYCTLDHGFLSPVERAVVSSYISFGVENTHQHMLTDPYCSQEAAQLSSSPKSGCFTLEACLACKCERQLWNDGNPPDTVARKSWRML